MKNDIASVYRANKKLPAEAFTVEKNAATLGYTVHLRITKTDEAVETLQLVYK